MKERPKRLPGQTIKVKTGYGNLYVTVNEFEGKPVELFAIIGKSGQSTTAKTEAIGRLVTLLLQSEVGIKEIAEQLRGIAGEKPLASATYLYKSIPDAIASILTELYIPISPDLEGCLTKGRIEDIKDESKWSSEKDYRCLACGCDFSSKSSIPFCPTCDSVAVELKLGEKVDTDTESSDYSRGDKILEVGRGAEI